MKMLLTGECCINNIFSIVDPTSFAEGNFESEVVKALQCCPVKLPRITD